jgi:hypothetical protein
MLNFNPQLRGMVDSNPQLREMMQNPELLRQLTSPETMQVCYFEQSKHGIKTSLSPSLSLSLYIYIYMYVCICDSCCIRLNLFSTFDPLLLLYLQQQMLALQQSLLPQLRQQATQ